MKALWVQIIDMYLVFRFVKGRCYGNQSILEKCHERRLIPLALFALLLEHELQYHCQNVRINSGDDLATSCKNLVNFRLVTPEIMELICVPRYIRVFGVNRPTHLHSSYCHSETPRSIRTLIDALTVSMTSINFVGFSSIYPSSRESTVYNNRQSALGLVYLRLLGGSTVMFCYYLLGCDTGAKLAICYRLCHIFLVIILVLNNLWSFICISVMMIILSK